LDVCRRFARARPNAAFAVIENAAHSIHMEHPQAFMDCALKFLSER